MDEGAQVDILLPAEPFEIAADEKPRRPPLQVPGHGAGHRPGQGVDPGVGGVVVPPDLSLHARPEVAGGARPEPPAGARLGHPETALQLLGVIGVALDEPEDPLTSLLARQVPGGRRGKRIEGERHHAVEHPAVGYLVPQGADPDPAIDQPVAGERRGDAIPIRGPPIANPDPRGSTEQIEFVERHRPGGALVRTVDGPFDPGGERILGLDPEHQPRIGPDRVDGNPPENPQRPEIPFGLSRSGRIEQLARTEEHFAPDHPGTGGDVQPVEHLGDEPAILAGGKDVVGGDRDGLEAETVGRVLGRHGKRRSPEHGDEKKPADHGSLPVPRLIRRGSRAPSTIRAR